MSTVCAIATPPAAGGISVIRISGEHAADIAAKVFRPVSDKPVKELKGYRAAYGKIYDGEERLDDGVLLMFRAPHSYTGEDVAEISCHGGIYVTRRVLAACIKAGAEPAAAGEFTKRALLNGKLSLTQAEAVTDIINAQSGQLLSCSNSQREGALYRRTEAIADMIMEISSQIAAWIDYPEDDTPVVTDEWLTEKLTAVQAEFSKLLSGYDTGRLIREGISCAIVGKPNVGKSTLMNLLSGEERSIVSDIAGTTRDIVEESISLGDVVLKVADCAGIRDTDDAIEKIGVEIMLKKLNNADLVLAVFDSSRPLEADDMTLIEQLSGKQVIPIVNKCDLQLTLDTVTLEKKLGSAVYISAKSDKTADVLSDAIKARLDLDKLDTQAGVLANERQRSCILRASDAVNEALSAVQLGLTPDAVGVMLEQALDAVYELSGRKASEEVIAEVFKRFCVGK
ncbi:MAG: tRNA uridine-5-carboxymethylaminomethyl(34) synthesis GTPase MnmE [Ruminococcaceae bacterium]|nr:tRNA uridine-5-carboxymethylaminomethyl(34) synthesis GTPase MnmE [Oscillospiraceae bacterium]